MKYLIIMLVFGCLISCESSVNTFSKTDLENNKFNLKTINIDSCEYIIYDDGIMESRVFSITHKGNCKNHKQ